LNIHCDRPRSEPFGPQQSRDHIDGDGDRADAPEYGDHHRHTRFKAAASAAKAMNAPAPIAKKIMSATSASSR
jgi:hypothetical protein